MATQERRVRAIELGPLGAHVLWASTLWEPSGYADEARSLITALTARGTRISARSLKPEVPGFRERVPVEQRRILAAVEANRGAKPLVAVTHGLPCDFQR